MRAPATDLAFEIIAGTAVVAQANGIHINIVQCRQDPVHLIVNCCSIRHLAIRKHGIPEYPSILVAHDVEHAADEIAIRAQVIRPGNRHVGIGQRLDDAKFAINSVGGLQ